MFFFVLKVFKSAWKEACASTIPSKVVIPEGWYKLQQIDLEGPCNAPIEVQVHGMILSPKNPYHLNGQDQWVRFQYINFFTLSGKRTFDGQGQMAWKQNNCPRNTNCIRFAMVRKILISKISIIIISYVKICLNLV